ncbi:uncharacterized protein [Elaeis guineensis]|uniref:Uncharacterized protein LOC105053881 isoform X2 n=1 Tax=Elaeis guineensis var. tenera TaxID=51953 RepID=A0A6I9S4Z9_ELAGV|nr:uncharacterized protein LOC105053881 isoform X2 [Elaeis guineensis]
MAVQHQPGYYNSLLGPKKTSTFSCCFNSSLSPPSSIPILWRTKKSGKKDDIATARLNSSNRSRFVIRSSGSTGGGGGGGLSWWKQPEKAPPASRVSLSDVVWPSAGAFAAMALLGRMDQMMASRGLSFTIAPLGAVCAVLFATPNSPAAQKYNMFIAQVGCAAFGVLALSIFGPGWLARGTALAASIAFMIITGATHTPAASLPILFIDGAKFHQLHLWYALFPGATGCVLLCLIQEIVIFLKNSCKF